jgi:hypothetical protein
MVGQQSYTPVEGGSKTSLFDPFIVPPALPVGKMIGDLREHFGLLFVT